MVARSCVVVALALYVGVMGFRLARPKSSVRTLRLLPCTRSCCAWDLGERDEELADAVHAEFLKALGRCVGAVEAAATAVCPVTALL